MARSIAEIKAAIIAQVQADAVLGPGLTSTSTVAIWRLWAYVVAVCQWTLENLFDFHKGEVQGIIKTQKPHSLQWYVTMAKAFQYGASLPADSDTYAVVPPADASVLIVSNAAGAELVNLLRIKVAKGTVGALTALSTPELTAFTAYMQKIKDAGVRVQCTSGAGDTLQPTIKIYYDALVLALDGTRLDGTEGFSVEKAIKKYLTELPFNGDFIVNRMIDAIEAVDGVVIADVQAVKAYYGAVPPISIEARYTPDAGYMVLDVAWFESHVTYVAYGG